MKSEEEIVHKIIRVLARTFSLWPLDRNVGSLRTYAHYFIWWIIPINFLLLIVPMFYEIYNNRDDILKFSHLLMELTALIECIMCIIFCRYHQTDFKKFLLIIESDTNSNTRNESKDLRSIFVARMFCIIFITFFVVQGCYIYTEIFSSYGNDRNLPVTSSYPFIANNSEWNMILKIHQHIGILTSVIVVLVDGIYYIFLCFAIRLLNALIDDLNDAKSFEQLESSIRHHHEALEYFKEINSTFKLVLSKTVYSYFNYFLAAGFVLLDGGNVTTMSNKFFFVLVVCIMRFYLFAAMGDGVSEKHNQISLAIYDTPWYDRSRETVKYLTIVMQRCQTPLRISANKMLPGIDSRMFAEYLSWAFSFVMAFRAMQTKQ